MLTMNFFLQVFCLLVFEMAVFMGLILPLPFTVKRKLFTFISESPVVAKLQYGLKVSSSFQVWTFRYTDSSDLDNLYFHPDPLHR